MLRRLEGLQIDDPVWVIQSNVLREGSLVGFRSSVTPYDNDTDLVCNCDVGSRYARLVVGQEDVYRTEYGATHELIRRIRQSLNGLGPIVQDIIDKIDELRISLQSIEAASPKGNPDDQ